jgi:peptidoglycan/xylan/chitin deacetylase (PgdA/CDA1 family)
MYPLITCGDRANHEICLTFDDGPNPHCTPELLDLLDRFEIKASFFLIGRHSRRFPDLVREIANRGHLVGNHTEEHRKGGFQACDATLTTILQDRVDYVRPPYYDLTICDEEAQFCAGKIVVVGDVDSEDYLDIPPSRIIENVLAGTRGGSIIGLHDGSDVDHETRVRHRGIMTALVDLIPQLLVTGFRPVRADELHLS